MKSSIAGIVEEKENEEEEKKNNSESISPGVVLKQNEEKRKVSGKEVLPKQLTIESEKMLIKMGSQEKDDDDSMPGSPTQDSFLNILANPMMNSNRRGGQHIRKGNVA